MVPAMNKQLLAMTLKARQSEFELLITKIAYLRKQNTLATDANQKFQLEMQVSEEESRLDVLRGEIVRLEAEYASAGDSPLLAAVPLAVAPVAPRIDTRNPTGISLRRLLGAVLRSASDFDAFCGDRYAKVFSRFSTGMGRLERENLLFQYADRVDIVAKLATDYPAEFEANKHLLIYEA